MNIRNSQYAKGTFLKIQYPWGIYRGGAAMCPDGKVRRLKRISKTADTFFSIPAAVSYKGTTVSGYVSVADYEDDRIVKFHPYANLKNGHLFSENET